MILVHNLVGYCIPTDEVVMSSSVSVEDLAREELRPFVSSRYSDQYGCLSVPKEVAVKLLPNCKQAFASDEKIGWFLEPSAGGEAEYLKEHRRLAPSSP